MDKGEFIIFSIFFLIIYLLVAFITVDVKRSNLAEDKCADLGYFNPTDRMNDYEDYLSEKISGSPFLFNSKYKVTKIICRPLPVEKEWTWEETND